MNILGPILKEGEGKPHVIVNCPINRDSMIYRNKTTVNLFQKIRNSQFHQVNFNISVSPSLVWLEVIVASSQHLQLSVLLLVLEVVGSSQLVVEVPGSYSKLQPVDKSVYSLLLLVFSWVS